MAAKAKNPWGPNAGPVEPPPQKVYLVQCWDDRGGKVDNYETLIGSPAELKALKKFLGSKHAHVQLSEVPKRASE